MEENLFAIDDYQLEVIQRLQTENGELRADLKLIKDTVFDLLKKIGFVQPDGSFREGLDMKAVMAFAMSIATGGKKVQEQFAGISALIPLVEKYKDL